MLLRVGIENNDEGFRTIAWVLEYPGCFAYGKDSAEALAKVPEAVRNYAEWLAAHGEVWFDPYDAEPRLDETLEAYILNEEYERVEKGDDEISAWFLHDWKPLSAQDIERGLKLLEWDRQDLLNTVQGLSTEKLGMKYEGERWSINGILNHTGGAEWWYLDRLGLAFPKNEIPKDPFARLEKVRASFYQILPSLEGSRQVVGNEGEIWSPRKVLRRAVWHERDHTIHIRKLL